MRIVLYYYSLVLCEACMVSGLAAVKQWRDAGGWFTAVGGRLRQTETDCDPPAKRLSASHGPSNALQESNGATHLLLFMTLYETK